MNQDSVSNKSYFIALILILGYAFIHTNLSGIYTDIYYDKLNDFSVRLPFAQRLLIPYIVNMIYPLCSLEINELYFLIECISLSILYVVLYQLLSLVLDQRKSLLLTWLFFLLLPLVTVINYRFGLNGKAAFYYYYDTPATLFTALGFYLCLQSYWKYLVACVFIATFNRESSILLVLIIPLLHWSKPRTIILPFLFAMLAYILARIIIMYMVDGAPGKWIEWNYSTSNATHLTINVYWLFIRGNILLFFYCFAGLPLLWFVFYDYIPLAYRPLRYLALAYFLGLLIVSNFTEARVFSEIIILLYLPAVVAVNNWLVGENPIYPSYTGTIYYFLNRYAVTIILTLVILFNSSINRILLRLIHS